MRPQRTPCLPCSSICNLLAEKNAISIPEKKKEKMSEIRIGVNSAVFIYADRFLIEYIKNRIIDSIIAQ